MKVADVVKAVETLAPPALAEDWDNIGLLVGSLDETVGRVIVTTDVTEAVLDEAVEAKAQMVVAHHPPIFRSINRVTACETPVVFEAVRRGVAVHVAHTNLDAAPGGTNDVLAEAIHLTDARPLIPAAAERHCKVVTFVPADGLSAIAEAAFAAGAGRVGNYGECSFFTHGIGTFHGRDGSNPAVGEPGTDQANEEIRLETVCPRGRAAGVRDAIARAHPYETPVIDTYTLTDFPAGCGAGRIGKLKRPVTVQTLVNRLKKLTGQRRASLVPGRGGGDGDGKGLLASTVAVFSGSGSSGVREALGQGAACYVTGELGYHDAHDAAARGLTCICLGHGHSERVGMARLGQRLAEMLPKLTVTPAAADAEPFVEA